MIEYAGKLLSLLGNVYFSLYSKNILEILSVLSDRMSNQTSLSKRRTLLGHINQNSGVEIALRISRSMTVNDIIGICFWFASRDFVSLMH